MKKGLEWKDCVDVRQRSHLSSQDEARLKVGFRAFRTKVKNIQILIVQFCYGKKFKIAANLVVIEDLLHILIDKVCLHAENVARKRENNFVMQSYSLRARADLQDKSSCIASFKLSLLIKIMSFKCFCSGLGCS